MMFSGRNVKDYTPLVAPPLQSDITVSLRQGVRLPVEIYGEVIILDEGGGYGCIIYRRLPDFVNIN